MSLPDGLHLPTCRERLQPILADRFQHHEARFLAFLLALQQEALLQQSPHDVQRRYGLSFCLIAQFAYGLRPLQSESADEDAEAAEEALFLGRQQVVTPLKRVAQGLLTCRQRARTPS